MEAIILAGGLGTRLRSVVNDLPKCMAPVAGKPFLHYVIQQLLNQGVDRFIFSLGYMHEAIEQFIKINYPSLNYKIALEDEPLGTGGAIQLAAKLASEKNVLVLNGDTMFTADVNALSEFHTKHHAACSIVLKPMTDFDRYGAVLLNKDHAVVSFKEKQFYTEGCINGGVYMLNVPRFLQEDLPVKFSFEKDYLEKQVGKQKLYGIVQDKYFIDIGIPEDYARAQKEFENPELIFSGK
ncbi:MAG: nucleotidyltransferase family protein [Ferruginibacter sp.]